MVLISWRPTRFVAQSVYLIIIFLRSHYDVVTHAEDGACHAALRVEANTIGRCWPNWAFVGETLPKSNLAEFFKHLDKLSQPWADCVEFGQVFVFFGQRRPLVGPNRASSPRVISVSMPYPAAPGTSPPQQLASWASPEVCCGAASWRGPPGVWVGGATAASAVLSSGGRGPRGASSPGRRRFPRSLLAHSCETGPP